MRLFAGLDLPPGVVRNVERVLEELRPAARIQWSPPGNLHVTTKFIGQWPEDRLPELETALGALPSRDAIPVRIQRLGFFPNERAPRVFWCGIEAPGIDALAADTDRAISALGIETEKRAFSPHLTLARIKERLDLQLLRQKIGAMPSLDFGTFTASSFFLYLSKPGPKGSVYTKLAEFSLKK